MTNIGSLYFIILSLILGACAGLIIENTWEKSSVRQLELERSKWKPTSLVLRNIGYNTEFSIPLSHKGEYYWWTKICEPKNEGSIEQLKCIIMVIDSESFFEVSRFEPEEIFEISGTSEPFRSSYEFTAEGGATRIVFTFELKEIDLVMRPFQKLIRTALQDGAAQTIENIKQLLEEAVAETERVPA